MPDPMDELLPEEEKSGGLYETVCRNVISVCVRARLAIDMVGKVVPKCHVCACVATCMEEVAGYCTRSYAEM